jgi:hypothetical protein
VAFEVHPEKLEAFQKQLEELAGQTGAANDYTGKHLELSRQDKGIVGQGIWAQATSQMSEVHAAITANLDKLNTLSTTSAGELGRAAGMYRNTDRAAAERLDNTY